MATQRTTRRPRNPYSEPVERPTGPDSFVTDVAFRVPCEKHLANLGWPCFHAEGIADGHLVIGNCNTRNKAAGFNGEINPNSLTRRPFEKTAPAAE
jgi:hypothetical protein